MRKIGIVTEYFYPHLGGITEHVYYYSKELIERGFDVTLITGQEKDPIDVKLPEGLKLIRIGKSLPFYINNSFAKVAVGWDLGKQVRRVLEEEKFDLLHIHSPLFFSLPILFLKYTNTVTIGTLHTYFDSLGSNFFFRIFRKVAQKFMDKMDGVIAVSSACEEALNKYIRGSYTVIPNGVATDWFSNPNGKIEKFNDQSANILFLGRLDPRNGLDNLISAFPKVLDHVPNARLIVAGDGPMRPFYEHQAGSLMGKKIFFEGQINGNRPEYYATCDVLCYPATLASLGVTLLEAMAAGKPVVGIDNPGFRQVIQNGVNGLFAPKADPEKLAETLLKVLSDKPLADRLAKNGQTWVEQYSWPHITDRVLDFYNQVYKKERGVEFAT